jgi:hypothetical protein
MGCTATDPASVSANALGANKTKAQSVAANTIRICAILGLAIPPQPFLICLGSLGAMALRFTGPVGYSRRTLIFPDRTAALSAA